MSNKEKFSKILYRILKALILESEKADKSDDVEGEYECLTAVLTDFTYELKANNIEV